MALYATNRFPGDGSTTSYEFNFVGKYIARDHVKVYQEDNETKVRTYVSLTAGNFLNDTTLRNLPVTPVGSTLVICRETPKPPLVDFVNGSRFTEYNMDVVARQGLFVAMEAMDAGDIDARQQLLDAVTVVAGLVASAQTSVSSATAAATAAAASALSASDSATTAQTARTDAEAANTAAQNAKTDAQTAATNAATSATNAGTSATNAAASATTANTRANAANTSATDAATSATNAANSATAAGTSATNAGTSATNAAASATAAATSESNALTASAGAAPMKCRVVVVNAASRIVRLERCGGQVVTLNGVVRAIPVAGLQLTLAATATPQYLYLGWDGSQLVLTASTSVPVFNSTLAQWVNPGNVNYAVVAYVRPDSLAQPERYLRNYYNGAPAHYTQPLTADYTGTWNGADQQIITMPILLLPGDTLDLFGAAAIMSTPAARVGDMTIKLGGSVLSRSRHTHQGAGFVWHTYTGRFIGQRGYGAADPAQQAIFELWYLPISTEGSSFTVAGDSTITKLSAIITPYRWA